MWAEQCPNCGGNHQQGYTRKVWTDEALYGKSNDAGLGYSFVGMHSWSTLVRELFTELFCPWFEEKKISTSHAACSCYQMSLLGWTLRISLHNFKKRKSWVSCLGWSRASFQNEIDLWRLWRKTFQTLHHVWHQLGYNKPQAVCGKYSKPQTASNALYLPRNAWWSYPGISERVQASTDEAIRASFWGSIDCLWGWEWRSERGSWGNDPWYRVWWS